MGCLFSCFTCCTADPVKAAKWKQQRSASFRKVKDKSDSQTTDGKPALTYKPAVRDTGGGDSPRDDVDTSVVVSSGEHDTATASRATGDGKLEVDVHPGDARGAVGGYDERFEGSARDASPAVGKDREDLTTRPNTDSEDKLSLQRDDDGVNNEFDIEQYSDSIGEEDDARIYVSQASISFQEAGLSTIEESTDKSGSVSETLEEDDPQLSSTDLPVENTEVHHIPQEGYQELPQETSTKENKEEVKQEASSTTSKKQEDIQDVYTGQELSISDPEGDREVPEQSFSPVPPAPHAPSESSGQSADVTAREHASDRFLLSYSQIDLDAIRKIWEYLAPKGDVAQLGVKVLISVFDDENKRIQEIVHSGLNKKFHKSRPVLRTEVELTLGRAVLGLLETTNQSLQKDKIDFDVYQSLGSKYYEYGVSYDFGKAIDDVLVKIANEETGDKFSAKDKLMWESFCNHVTTNVDIGYTKAKKQK